MDFFAHESCYIDEETKIGKGTKIWHFSHVMSGSTIGENCNIGQNVVISPDVTLGNNCKVQTGVVCEDGVFLGPSCVFTNVINPRAFIEKKDEYRKTTIKEGASIGANATIVCGNTIGKYAIIGAGAVVTKDVGDYEIVVGNPARHHGYACSCGENLKRVSLTDYICEKCDKKYLLNDYKLSEVSNE